MFSIVGLIHGWSLDPKKECHTFDDNDVHGVTLNQWLFVIGDWHDASSMPPSQNVFAYFPNLFATELLFCDIFGLSEGCFR